MLSDKLTFLVSSFVLLSLSFSHYLLPLITELTKFFKEQKKNYRKLKMSLFEKSTKKCTKSHNGKVMKQTTLLLSLLNKIMLWLWSFMLHRCQKTKYLWNRTLYVHFFFRLRPLVILHFTNGLLLFWLSNRIHVKKTWFLVISHFKILRHTIICLD